MEILQNSILKLIVRQGSDQDRKAIILDSGELGYTVDTYRLFVGDGFLSGGNVVGNLFKGSAPTITNPSLWPALVGDYAFASDTSTLYILQSGVGNLASDWVKVGGVYSSGNNQITISPDNIISLAPISANYISNNAVASPLYINTGKISLLPLSANSFSENAVQSPLVINSGKISLPPLSANTIATDALSSPLTLSNGRIALRPLSSGMISNDAVDFPLYMNNGKISLNTLPISSFPNQYMLFSNGLDAFIEGVSYYNTPVQPFSGNISVQTRQIHAKYNGLSGQSLEFGRDVANVEYLSAGHYRFLYSIQIQPNYIPTVQISGEDALGFTPRVILPTLSSCDVKVMNSSGLSTDANLYLLINY